MAADKSDLEDSSQNKAGRRPQIDPWAAIRMERYLRPVMGETGLSALVEILAGGMPGYFEDLSRVLEPAAKEVPLPSYQASPFPQSVQAAVRHTREIVGSRDDIMELLTKERSALPNDWQSLRRWLATDVADYLEHLQKNGTPPETLVMDTVSLLKTWSWEDGFWQDSRGAVALLAFRLRRLLDEVPNKSRGDRWENAISTMAEMLVGGYVSGANGKRVAMWGMPYAHEVMLRGLELPLEDSVAIQVAGAISKISTIKGIYSVRENIHMMKVKIQSSADSGVTCSEEASVFNLNWDADENYHVILRNISLNGLNFSSKSVSVLYAINIYIDDIFTESINVSIRCCRYIDDIHSNEKIVICAIAMSRFFMENVSIYDWDIGFVEAFLDMLIKLPIEWRECHRDDLLAPLMLGLEVALGDVSERLRKIFRLFVLPDAEPMVDLAVGFGRLAIEVAREGGVVIPETMPELLRVALESALGVDEVARAEREIDDLAQEVLALPDDPCALIREVYGPYLENGPLVAAGVMSVARWNRWVRLSRGEGLPADIGLALRTVFAERA